MVTCDIKFENTDFLKGSNKLVLAGDVSATNVLMGLYSVNHDNFERVFEAIYNGQELVDFYDQVVKDVLKRKNLTNQSIDAAVYSPAGPIIQGRCQMTNAKYSLDTSVMGMREALINDFKAIAYAVATRGVKNELVHEKLRGEEVKGELHARIGIHGAGTGLGTARLEYDCDKDLYFPLDSEGGHKFLPVNLADNQEVEIGKWLMRYTSARKPIYEDVLSGRGIERIFDYFVNHKIQNNLVGDISFYLDRLKNAKDKAEDIGTSAMQSEESIFKNTMQFFWRVYGRALHDLAVHENARGGIWVAGGIIRKHFLGGTDSYKAMIKDTILTEFNSGSTHRDWLAKIPINVILDKRVGLEGCIQVALNDNYMQKEMNEND